MAAVLTTLPEEIYPILKSYLLYDDYLCFVNSAKKDFYEIKRKTIYMKLTKKYSMMFLRNENNFQQQIKALVADPSQQISIQLTDDVLQITNLIDLSVHRVDYESDENCFPHLPLVKEKHFRSSICRIADISRLSHLQSVTLINCISLIDISPLRDVPEVYLWGCSKVRDFSMLGKQRKLTIHYCKQLNNVSTFSNIIELSLFDCPLLEDISPLKDIPNLSISSCVLVRDLSPLLGNHEKLEIKWCNYELAGYEILWNIPIVSLWNCNISDMEVLRTAKSVSLYRCDDLIDVSPLVNVKKFYLDSCEKIADINMLANIPELTLRNLPLVTNVDAFLKNQNQNLTISVNKDTVISEVLFAVNPRRLRIYDIVSLEVLKHISLLNNLQFLDLSSLIMDFSTNGLTTIPVISFSFCAGLTNINGLGKNREVRIIDCPLIRDVSSLRNVPLVTIKKCKGIQDYSCLSNVPRLRIFSNS